MFRSVEIDTATADRSPDTARPEFGIVVQKRDMFSLIIATLPIVLIGFDTINNYKSRVAPKNYAAGTRARRSAPWAFMINSHQSHHSCARFGGWWCWL